MAKPPATVAPATTTTQTTPTKAQQKQLAKNGSVSQNPLFFLGKVNHPSGSNIAMARSTIFNSQSNLPVQIQSTPIGHKPKLRRFISQYSNMFSVDDFENARLARRNELELKQRQLNRYKMNSLSSGGDCSTGDSKGSKFSNEVSRSRDGCFARQLNKINNPLLFQSNPELLPADLFLERFSLPRVVRITTTATSKTFPDETMQSSSSNGSSASGASSTSVCNKKDILDSLHPNGELYLLYRYLRNRKIYHGFNAKNSSNRKKGVMIPQEFSGKFIKTNSESCKSSSSRRLWVDRQPTHRAPFKSKTIPTKRFKLGNNRALILFTSICTSKPIYNLIKMHVRLNKVQKFSSKIPKARIN